MSLCAYNSTGYESHKQNNALAIDENLEYHQAVSSSNIPPSSIWTRCGAIKLKYTGGTREEWRFFFSKITFNNKAHS
jgi:hypothetical protein